MPDELKISEIGQIALTVQDLDRARDFYQNTLGLKLLFHVGTMAFFQCGAIRLMIGLAEKPVATRSTILYFRVADIEVSHRVLIERGVVFAHSPHLVAKMPDHELWMCAFEDTEGNPLQLMCEVR